MSAQTFAYSDLVDRAAALLEHSGVPAAAARLTADGLVEADARGLPSHGLMLLPMYLDRIRAGSVDPTGANTAVVDLGAAAIFDSHNGLGQVTAQHAMESAIARAAAHGVGLVACRNAFHFGGAYRYTALAAEAGMVSIAAANTRPLMPTPGGARAVVGNNPIAFGAPRAAGDPIIFDAALSEAALGKIRLAASAGRAIPTGWATDADGQPTTDAERAIAGMLLPSGGNKGFGFALFVDLLTGVLAGGGFGSRVTGLYADPATPYGSAQFFLAIDATRLSPDFPERAETLAREILDAPRAAGAGEGRIPGARGAAARRTAERTGVALPASVVEAIRTLEAAANQPAAPPVNPPVNHKEGEAK